MNKNQGKKNQVYQLRQQGFSLGEIAQQIGISKSTVSLWVRGLELSDTAKTTLLQKRQESREKAKQALASLRREKQHNILLSITNDLQSITYTPQLAKLLCAYLYWAEGGKTGNAMVFMNSDALMMKVFISLLRKGFSLDEKKFKVLVHIHKYHDREEILNYWSKVTGISRAQFFRPYLKENTGKNKRINYKGSCSLRYYDVAIVTELKGLYNASSQLILKSAGTT